MILRTFKVRVKHDHGRITFLVKSPTAANAIYQIMTAERCPRRAILSVKETARVVIL